MVDLFKNLLTACVFGLHFSVIKITLKVALTMANYDILSIFLTDVLKPAVVFVSGFITPPHVLPFRNLRTTIFSVSCLPHTTICYVIIAKTNQIPSCFRIMIDLKTQISCGQDWISDYKLQYVLRKFLVFRVGLRRNATFRLLKSPACNYPRIFLKMFGLNDKSRT